MTYVEVGTGGLDAGGCVVTTALHPVVTTYGAGDVLFSQPKARKGVLEKVVIKTIRTILSRKTLIPVTLYTDTLNGLWNEDELVPYGTAAELVEDYRLRVDAERARLRCR